MKVLAAVILFLWCSLQSHGAAAQARMTALDSMRLEVNTLVNAKRSIFREAPLELNDTLNAIAQKHSEDMAAGKLPLGHDGFDKRAKTIQEHFGEFGPIGENVVAGMDAAEAVDLWWTSEGHKANMTGDYTLTGIGAAKNKDGMWLCTQIFIKR